MALSVPRTFPRALFPLSLAVMGVGAELPGQERAPAVVIFLAVDQLRPDYLVKYGAELTGGLAWIAREGTVYLRGARLRGMTVGRSPNSLFPKPAEPEPKRRVGFAWVPRGFRPGLGGGRPLTRPGVRFSSPVA